MKEVELQILQTVQNYEYSEMPIREIPFGVDANFSYCEIQSKTIDLARRGYLHDRQLYFSLTDLGREALTAAQQSAATDALQLRSQAHSASGRG